MRYLIAGLLAFAIVSCGSGESKKKQSDVRPDMDKNADAVSDTKNDGSDTNPDMKDSKEKPATEIKKDESTQVSEDSLDSMKTLRLTTLVDEPKPVDLTKIIQLGSNERFVIVKTPKNGTLDIENGGLTYTPSSSFYGRDSAEITILDGAKVITTISILVAVNTSDKNIVTADLDNASLVAGDCVGLTIQRDGLIDELEKSLNLATNHQGIYSDEGCKTELKQIVMDSMKLSATVYLRFTKSGNQKLSLTPSGHSMIGLDLTVAPGARIARIAVTGPKQIAHGACSGPFQINLFDEFDNRTNLTNFGTDYLKANISLYSDGSCENAISRPGISVDRRVFDANDGQVYLRQGALLSSFNTAASKYYYKLDTDIAFDSFVKQYIHPILISIPAALPCTVNGDLATCSTRI